MKELHGKGVSGGIAIGRVKFHKSENMLVKRIHVENAERETERFRKAKEITLSELKNLYEKALKEVGEANAQIFEIHQMMLDDSDYIESFAYVGFKTDGSPIIIIFDYAICTSGLSLEGKNKEAAVVPATFECVANLTAGGNTSKLPYHIYVAKASEE